MLKYALSMFVAPQSSRFFVGWFRIDKALSTTAIAHHFMRFGTLFPEIFVNERLRYILKIGRSPIQTLVLD